MRGPSQTNQPAKATFVFKGTIKKLKSATMKDVPLSEHTAIMRVDQIIEAPPDLAGYASQNITVELSGREPVRVGEQMIVHATGWMFGDGVAVRSLREEPVTTGVEASAGADKAVEQHVANLKHAHFAAADLVVCGKVVTVRLPADSVSAQKQTNAAAPRPISEHDPKWREAIIQIDEVLKGSHEEKQVVVRFPASSDVMWHGTQKFEAGQQGYFMLHKATPPSGRLEARRAEDADYQVLDSSDFQPFDEPGGIKTFLESKSTRRKK